jgi:hypothetical protein
VKVGYILPAVSGLPCLLCTLRLPENEGSDSSKTYPTATMLRTTICIEECLSLLLLYTQRNIFLQDFMPLLIFLPN